MVLLFSLFSRLCQCYHCCDCNYLHQKLSLFQVKLIEAEDKYAIGDEPYPYVQATFKWASANVKYPKYPKFTIGDESYPYVPATFKWGSSKLLILQTHPWHRLLWTHPFWSHWVFKDILTQNSPKDPLLHVQHRLPLHDDVHVNGKDWWKNISGMLLSSLLWTNIQYISTEFWGIYNL